MTNATSDNEQYQRRAPESVLRLAGHVPGGDSHRPPPADTQARAGSYIVAQCSPGVYPGAPDAGFTASTTHYTPRADCSPRQPGLQITHTLSGAKPAPCKAPTAPGYGRHRRAPTSLVDRPSAAWRPKTASTATSPSPPIAVRGVSFENQNDDQGHESGIPAGNWRYLVARLECTQPNEGNRCVGAARRSAHLHQAGAHPAHRRRSPDDRRSVARCSRAPILRGPQTSRSRRRRRGRRPAIGAESTSTGKQAAGDDLSAVLQPAAGQHDLAHRRRARPASARPTPSTPRRRPFRGSQLGLGLRLRLRADR